MSKKQKEPSIFDLTDAFRDVYKAANKVFRAAEDIMHNLEKTSPKEQKQPKRPQNSPKTASEAPENKPVLDSEREKYYREIISRVSRQRYEEIHASNHALARLNMAFSRYEKKNQGKFEPFRAQTLLEAVGMASHIIEDLAMGVNELAWQGKKAAEAIISSLEAQVSDLEKQQVADVERIAQLTLRLQAATAELEGK